MTATALNPESSLAAELDDSRGTHDAAHARRMRRLVNRLLDEAPKPDVSGITTDDQTPAMLCNVVIRDCPQPFSGVLSQTPEGTLKLLTPVKGKAGDKDLLLEIYFDYADLTVISLERTPEMSRIVGLS